MDFRVLGPVEVVSDGHPVLLGGPKQRSVLATLVAAAGVVVSVDQLIDELWGASPPEAPKASVQSYVSNLRRAFGSEAERLATSSPGYVLRAERSEVDALRFTDGVETASDALTENPELARDALVDALSLWRGPPYADVEHGEIVAPEVSRLVERRLVALEARAEAAIACDDQAAAITELGALATEEPLRERVHALLMLALYQTGRQADALSVFQRLRRSLVDQLGIDPSPELVDLEARILRQDPALLGQRLPGVAGSTTARRLGGYELRSKLGAGTSGVVYHAVQPALGRDVAIKILHAELANDPEFIQQFEVEAQTIARLEHPHIVPLYDYWREPNAAYLVMRWLRGGSVADTLETRSVSVEAAAGLIMQIASALAVAHDQGVVHMDVKPSNILLDEADNGYLADFGIATRRVTAGSDPASDASDGRLADLAGLGSILAELLSRHDQSDVPPELSEAVRRATAAEPADRYRSVEEFSSAVAIAIDAPAPSRTRPVNPFKGLRAFTESDAGDFFGREAVVRDLTERLADGCPLLTIVGPSGSGKSSVVRAGLVPALRRGALDADQRWVAAVMRPGSDPFAAIEQALATVSTVAQTGVGRRLRSGTVSLDGLAHDGVLEDRETLVLVIDQFEELFTAVVDERERAQFVEVIGQVADQHGAHVRVVVTLRADFFDQPLLYPALAAHMARSTVMLGPLSEAELERAVLGPAERVGTTVEAGFVAEVLADVRGQRGALPLVQYALTEVFDRTRGDHLTVDAYRAVGGVSQAVAEAAERVHQALGSDDRALARQVMLQLVHVVEGRPDTARRVRRAELGALGQPRDATERVLEAFGRARLFAFDHDPSTRLPTVELAHDSLLGEWDRLRLWVEQAREDIALERRLAQLAADWREADDDPSFLASGSRLEQFDEWEPSSSVALSVEESAFLSASRTQRDARAEEERARQRLEQSLERRARRRLSAGVAVLLVAAVVAAGLAAFAFSQRSDANRQADLATAGELAAAAAASLDADPQRSLLFALESLAIAESPTALEALHAAIRQNHVVEVLPGSAIDVSDDGSVLAIGDDDGMVTLRDLEGGVDREPINTGPDPIGAIALAPDGARLATSTTTGGIVIWDTATGRAEHELDGADAQRLEFSPDGSALAATRGTEGLVQLWDTTTGEPTHSLPVGGFLSALAFSPDGTALYAGNEAAAPAPVIQGWDVSTGRPLEVETEAGIGVVVAVSPDGSTIAGAGTPLRTWDLETGTELASFFGHTGLVLDLTFSPDGSQLISAGDDGTLRVWDAATGESLLVLTGHQRGVFDVETVPGSDLIVSVGEDARIWDASTSTRGEVAAIQAHDRETGGVSFTPDGTRLVSASWDQTVKQWDAQTGELLATQEGQSGVFTPTAVSADGTMVAAIDAGLQPAIWDAGLESELVDLDRTPDTGALAFSPDGARLAAAGLDGSLSVLDTTTGERLVIVPDAHTDQITGVDISPTGQIATGSWDGTAKVWTADGQPIATLDDHSLRVFGVSFAADGTLATASVDGTVRIWSPDDWQAIHTLSGHLSAVGAASFSPDGSILASAGFDGIRVWDTETGEELYLLDGPTAAALYLDISDDGRRLAAGGRDGIVRIYALDAESLIEIAEPRLVRDPTPEECRRLASTRRCG